LLDINESLGETIDLISPTRELIREGKILRIAARDGGRYERYMFLVSSVVCYNTAAAMVIVATHLENVHKVGILNWSGKVSKNVFLA